MPAENASPDAPGDQTRTDRAQADKATIPPNGPDYGSAPPFNQAVPPYGMPPFPGMPPFGAMPFGSGFSGMPGYGMPPFPMPHYAAPGYAGQGFPGAPYPGLDQMMSQMMDRAAFMHRCMITMSNIAAEISRACQLLAQNPSQIGMPHAGPAPGGGAVPGDKPVDMEALKQALADMDPVQAQKTLYAVQMMQWVAGMMRGGQPGNAPPSGEPASKAW